MNKLMLKKDVIDTVCIVLEKEKNSDSVVFTSARGIARKSKKENIKPKDIVMALDYLEKEHKIEIVSKSNRQTVLRVKDNLFELDLNAIKEENEETKDIKLTITPKKLFDLFKSKSKEDNTVEMSCKDVRKEFECSFSQVIATLKLLEKANKISYSFVKGMIFVVLKTNNDLSSKDIVESNDNDIFDEIGENLESIFAELDKLRKENESLNKKLVMAEVANKRLREENTTLAARCESMQDRNNRLYNQLVNMNNIR